jgi:t-SNARE complex subunit (syntaxin)
MFKTKDNILYVKGKCEEALQSYNIALKVAHVHRCAKEMCVTCCSNCVVCLLKMVCGIIHFGL